MAKQKVIEVDFDDYEERESVGYNGPEPKKGIYDGRLVSFREHTSGAGNEGLEWVFEITEGEYAGWRGWVYSNMDRAKWKTQQIAKAIQGGSEKKVKLLPADEEADREEATVNNKTVKKASPVRLVIRQEKYEGEPRGRISTILPEEGSNDSGEDEDGPSF